MNPAPSSWRKVRLGECCQVVSGSTPRRDEPKYWGGDLLWATPRDLSALNGPVLHTTAERITKEGYESCSTTRLPAGAVLFSSRAPVGLVAIAREPMCTNQGFKSLIPGPDVDSGYLYWCLRRLGKAIERRGSGTTFTEVSKEVVSRFEIPLPPLAQQRRIAAVLDKADVIRRKRRESLRLLDEFLRSAFLEMFGDPVRNERGWEIRRVGEVVAETQYGVSEKANLDGLGIPVVRMNNLTSTGEIDLSDIKWCDVSPPDIRKYTVRRGDILFNRTNSPELVGKTAVWDRDEQYAFAGYLVRIRFQQDRVLPQYFAGFMNSSYGKRLLFETAKPSINMSNISASTLLRLRMPIPPIRVQTHYSSLAGSVRLARGRLEGALQESDSLFDSLAQRAFRREL